MVKLPNQKILLFGENYKTLFKNKEIKIYAYKECQLIMVDQKELETFKNNVGYDNNQICAINEKEIAISFSQFSVFSFGKYYLGFFDIEKDKKIQTFEYKCLPTNIFSLINEQLFIYSIENKIYPVHLKNHSRKKEFKLPNFGIIHSVFPLNNNHFIAAQENFINYFELENDTKFSLIYSITLNSNVLMKFPKNRFVYKNNMNLIHLFGQKK